MLVETVIRDYLKSKLGVPVLAEIPAEPAEQYVTLQKIDGGKRNHIDAATIEFQSYAMKKSEAAKLDESVREAIYEIVYDENADISSVELGGNSDSTDKVNKRYRYECIFNFFY